MNMTLACQQHVCNSASLTGKQEHQSELKQLPSDVEGSSQQKPLVKELSSC